MSKKSASQVMQAINAEEIEEIVIQEDQAPKKRKQKKAPELKDLEQRIGRLEKKIQNNERFARTFANSASTQVLVIDTIQEIMRRGLRQDADIHAELTRAIKIYDKHKVRRWFSGFFGVLFWLLSIGVAAVVGAFIYWVFSGQM